MRAFRRFFEGSWVISLLFAVWLAGGGQAQELERAGAEPTTVATESKPLDVVDIASLEKGLVGKVLRVALSKECVMDFCWCPPGRFIMGSPLNEEWRGGDEGQADVLLTQGFWLARTPCTQAQWQALMGTTPVEQWEKTAREYRRGDLREMGDTLPMYFVNFEDVSEFSRKLDKMLKLPRGWHVALPTEAQWEYACRAGTQTTYYTGNTLTRTHVKLDVPLGERPLLPVASYPSNPWGLHDMVGNVHQICSSKYEDFLRGGVDPIGAPNGVDYVCRGSEGTSLESEHRCSDRGSRLDPGARANWAGFRIVLTGSPSGAKPMLAASSVAPAQSLPELDTFPLPLTLEELLAEVPESAPEDLKATLTTWHRSAVEDVAKRYGGSSSEGVARCLIAIAHWEDHKWTPTSSIPITFRLLLAQCLAGEQRYEEAARELQLTLALQSIQPLTSDHHFWLGYGASFAEAPPEWIQKKLRLLLATRDLLAATLLQQAQALSGAEKACMLDDARSLVHSSTNGWIQLCGVDHESVLKAHQLSQAIKRGLADLPSSARPSESFVRKLGVPPLPGLTAAARARLKPAIRAALDDADPMREEALNLLLDGKFSESQTLIKAAANIYEATLGNTHPLTLKCQTFLIGSGRGWNERDLVLKEYQAMLALLDRHVGKDDPWTLWCARKVLDRLSNGFADEKKKDEKEALARRIATSTEQSLGKDHRDTAFARWQLAKVLEENQNYEEAEKVLTDVADRFDRLLGSSSSNTQDVHSSLGYLLLINGEPRLAADHLQTALIFARLGDHQNWSDERPLLNLAYALNLLAKPACAAVFAAEVGDRKEHGSHAQVFLPALAKVLNLKFQPDEPQEPLLRTDDRQDWEVGSIYERIEEIGIGKISSQALIGDGECQYLNARLYLDGITGPESPVIAKRWHRLSAEKGYLKAQTVLAEMGLSAKASPAEQEEGLRWARLAAERGGSKAMFLIALAYMEGFDVVKDSALAMEWLEKSATAGYLRSCGVIGVILTTGEGGVGQDLEAACHWLARGAAQDDAFCLYRLGIHYYRGEGVPRQAATAVALWRRAAEQGHRGAQYKLGLVYTSPIPEARIVKDPSMAYYWLALAAAQDLPEAAKAKKEISESFLNKAERNEMDAKIKAFTPRAPKPIAPVRSEGSQGSETLGGIAPQPPRNEEKVSGTGFFITAAGHLVTNHHVIENASSIRVRFSTGQEIPATLVTQDENADLAILKITPPSNTQLRSLPLAPSRGIKLGASVATVGYPNYIVQGLSPKLARGDIASLAGIQDNPGQFQISVPIQPGNSGGALVDLRGNVVGVVSAILDQKIAIATTGTLASNVSYAVKSSLLTNLIESVPALAEQLPPVIEQDLSFEDMVETVQRATVMLQVTVPSKSK